MLLRLTDDQISAYWNNIRQTLLFNDLPMADASEEKMKVILEGLLSGSVQAWVLFEMEDMKEKIYAMAITSFVYEPVTLTKNLVIYNLYGYTFVPPRLWLEGIKTLRKYAKAEKCHNIIAYSKIPRVLEIVKELGGDTSMHVISLEID